jgi:hypothetical protein
MKRDIEILSKYRFGKAISKEDIGIIFTLRSIGLMSTGFNIKNGEIIPDAKTTKQGLYFLRISVNIFQRIYLFLNICNYILI